MAVVLTTAGDVQLVAGETYIVDPSLTGVVRLVYTGTGPVDFTVLINEDSGASSANFASINFAATTGQNYNPTVHVAEGVDAKFVNFLTPTGGSFDGLTYNVGAEASIGNLQGAPSNSGSAVTTYNVGDGAEIGAIIGRPSAYDINFGDNVTMTGQMNIISSAQGADIETGSGFIYQATSPFQVASTSGIIDVKIGAGADLNGQSVTVTGQGSATEVSASFGDGSINIGNVSMSASGGGTRTLEFGENTVFGSVTFGGNGPVGRTEVELIIGDGAVSTGTISGTGTNVNKTITLGDGVQIGGGITLTGGSANNVITVGDDFTLTGDFAGSSNGLDAIAIGDQWQINGRILLGGGNDRLSLGRTSRDAGGVEGSGEIDGGAAADQLTIFVRRAALDDLRQAALQAGWTENPDGSWSTGGNTLTWNNQLYKAFETVEIALCFAAGTRIRTPLGAVPVENLRVGDLVETLDEGPQVIRWIGRRALDSVDLAAQPQLAPVRIAAGAMGGGLPEHDLVVLPQHRVLIKSSIARQMFGTSQVLATAKHLLALDGIEQLSQIDAVTYIHFLFDRHQIVFAEGALAESLLSGPEARKALSAEALAEIETLFGVLVQPGETESTVPARPLLTGQEARSLAARHAADGRSLCYRPAPSPLSREVARF